MEFLFKIYIAYILDLILGDPYRIPHPVQIIGKLISFLEKKLINFPNKRFYGGVLNILVLSITFIVCYFLQKIIVIEIYLMYTIFSTRCLPNEGNKVYKILKEDKSKVNHVDLKKINEEKINMIDKLIEGE